MMPTSRPVLERTLEKCVIGDCWEFTGCLNANGYGQVHNPDGSKLAHRAVWQQLVGEIPDGMQLDHMCQNKACVNPDHLRVVDGRTNIMAAGNHISAKRRRQTYCKRGHLLEGENLSVSSPYRECRACKAIRHQESKEMK